MQLILISRNGGRAGALDLRRRPMVVLATAVALLAVSLFIAAGYGLAVWLGQPYSEVVASRLESELRTQGQIIQGARRESEEHMNALASRLAQLQARLIRLDALGDRLTKIGKLDKGEFNFEQVPAVGGPESGDGVAQRLAVPDFVMTLEDLAAQIADRERQLSVLEALITNQNLQAELYPTGRPTEGGWVSSYFGFRTDPFTGLRDRHDGIDIAGRAGSSIIAVAAGVVTWSGPRYGYGLLVEVNHGNGYATRYAHNLENLVTVGDTVKRGQALARMGSTGRSTGPHVHFEVLQHGRPVDPLQYVLAKN